MNQAKALYIILFLLVIATYCCNAQEVKLTKYGFGLYFDTTTVPPPPPPAEDTSTTWGILVANSDDYPDLAARIHRAKELGLTIFRYGYIFGNVYRAQQIIDSGMQVELTFNYYAASNDGNPNNNAGYVTDTATFKTDLANTLNSTTGKPVRICIRNEPANYNYWDTSHPERYVNELRAAATVCESFGIPVHDGGMLQNSMYKLFRYYEDNNLTDSLQLLTDRTGITNTNSPNVQTVINWNDVVWAGIASIPYITEANLHFYYSWRADTANYVSPRLIPELGRHLMSVTGKGIITNETGTNNHSWQLLYAELDEWRELNAKYVAYYAGNGYEDGCTNACAIDLSDYYRTYLLQ